MFTNLYVALCGAALTAASYSLLGMPPRFDHVAGLVFCCTMVIYNLDRLVEPHPGDSEHERWVESHHFVLWCLTLVNIIGAILFAKMLQSQALLSLPIAGAVAVGYCLPVVRIGGRWQRLKALPGAKLILIALVWTYATAGLPVLEAGSDLGYENTLMLFARFFFIAAVALPFDLPDMQRDKRSGIKTVPLLLGVAKTKQLALLFISVSALCSLLQPGSQAAAIFTSCVCVAALLAALRRDRGVVYFMLALDGMLLIQASLLWISAA